METSNNQNNKNNNTNNHNNDNKKRSMDTHHNDSMSSKRLKTSSDLIEAETVPAVAVDIGKLMFQNLLY